MKNGTSTTIDAAGRIVIPKSIREAAGLRQGIRIEVRLEAGHVELEPMPLDVRVERRDGLVVAVPMEATEPLTASDVRRTQERLRRREV